MHSIAGESLPIRKTQGKPCSSPGPQRVVNVTSSAGAGQLHHIRVSELQPHPSYAKHVAGVPIAMLSALAKSQDVGLLRPIIVTPELVILDGYDRLLLAEKRGVEHLPCYLVDLTELEQLSMLLLNLRGTKGLNPFLRIQIVLEHEPALKAQALANLRLRSRPKGLQNLAEGQAMDVRAELGRLAGVSGETVRKARQILERAIPQIIHATQSGEIHIDAAWKWSRLPTGQQEEALKIFRREKRSKAGIRAMLSKHRKNPPVMRDGLLKIREGLKLVKQNPALSEFKGRIEDLIQEIDIANTPRVCAQQAARAS
jgi:ParB-like chromosome segregation protein Spo0J